MLMRYHIGLGVGHVFTQCQASNDWHQDTAGKWVGDTEVECVPELPDDEEPSGEMIIQDVDSSSEHSSDFCGEREEEEEALGDEEFLVDEDMYGY
jgi:hypothetical protein